MTERLEKPGGPRDGRAALRVVEVVVTVRMVEESDAQRARVPSDLTGQRAGERRWVVRLAGHPCADRVEHRGRIAHRPRDGAVDGASGPALTDPRALRHACPGRLEPDQAALTC